MIKNFLLKGTAIPQLAKGLDVYSIRQKTISSNIANIQTKGYRRKEVEFESELQNAMGKRLVGARTDEHHLTIGRSRNSEAKPEVIEDASRALNSGVNNVDIDREIVDQVKNEIRFLYGSRMINRNYADLRASIKGRYDQ